MSFAEMVSCIPFRTFKLENSVRVTLETADREVSIMLPYCIFKTYAKESAKDIAAWYISMKLGVLVRHWMVHKLDDMPRLTYKPHYPHGMDELFKSQKDKTDNKV